MIDYDDYREEMECNEMYIDELLDQIDRLKNADNWISVEDTPKEYADILIQTVNDDVLKGWFCGGCSEKWYIDETATPRYIDKEDVKYWQYPPKAREDK